MAYQSRLELVIDSRSGERSLRRMDAALAKTEKRGEQAFGNLKTVAAGFAGVLATIGVGAGFARTFSTLAQFDKEMATLGSVTRASAQDMEAFSEQARRLGSTTVFGANQAAQAQKFLAQAGLETNQVLSATPEVLSLAQAGMLDLGTAADLATDIMAQMGLQVSDLSRINDVLVATAQSATTDVRQLGEAFSYAGPIASSFGISLEQTASALGVISSGGIKASRAGTGLLGILRQLANPTDDARAALSSYGITLDEVDIAANGLLPVVDTLAGANISAADTFRIFGSEAGAAAQVLLKDSRAVAKLNEELGGAEGRASDAAGAMSDNLASAAVGLSSAFEGLILKTGEEGLTGALQEAIDISAGVVRVFAGLGDTLDETFDEDQVGTIEALATGIEALSVAAGARLTAALASATASKVADTRASIAGARAEAVAAQAVARRTGAELQSAKALLSTAQLEARATQGTSAHTFALSQLSVARVRAAEAAGAHAAATNTATAAMGRASIAARGAAGALALVGGPLGLLVGAGGLLYMFRDELGLTQQRIGLTEGELESFREELDEMSGQDLGQSLASLNASLEEATLKAAAAREEVAKLRAEDDGYSVTGVGNLSDQVAGINALAEAQEKLRGIEQKRNVSRIELWGRWSDAVANGTAATDANSDANDRNTETIVSQTDAAEAAARAEEAFAQSLGDLQDRLFPAEAAQRNLREEQMLLQAALMQGRIGIDRYLEAWERLNTAQSRDITGGFMNQVASGGIAEGLDASSDAAERFGLTFSSALEDAIVNFEDLGDVAAGFFTDLQRMIVRTQITEPLGDAIGGFDWGGMIGGLFSGAGGGATVDTSGVAALGYNTGSFSSGGYTGDGGKHDPAGIVHRGEFVVKKSVVDNPGVRPMLERLNKGYAEGGYVGPSSSSAGGGISVHIHNEGGEPMEVSRSEQRAGNAGQKELHLWLSRAVDQRMKGNFESGVMDRQMGRLYGLRRKG